MSALIIVESLVGSTRQVAEAVAAGLRTELPGDVDVDVVDAAEARSELAEEVRLLLVGGPTHAFSLTDERTREEAYSRGAAGHRPQDSGTREWIGRVHARPDVDVVTFDLRVRGHGVAGPAAGSAARALRTAGFGDVEHGQTFWLEDTDGPLEDGQLERARAWGASLAHRFRVG